MDGRFGRYCLGGSGCRACKADVEPCKEITGLRGDLQVLSKAANDMTAKMAKFETDTYKTEYSEV